jgi:hypothetical protein
MSINNNFERIKEFVDSESKYAPMIRSYGSGLKVHDLRISPLEDRWQLSDKSGSDLGCWFSKKLAVLAALLIRHKRKMDHARLQHLDQQLAIATADQRLYNHLIQKNLHDYRAELYAARISRTQQIQQNIRSQISVIEKSLSLQ